MTTAAKLIIETLIENGYDARYAGKSETDFGTSEYVNVWQNEANCTKVRISDHSVTNYDRIFSEIHFPITVDPQHAAFHTLEEIRFRFDRDKFFEKREILVKNKTTFETPKPLPDDEIISERIGKKGHTVYTVVRTTDRPEMVFTKKVLN